MFLSRGRECAPANAANEDANEDCTVGNTHAENTATPRLRNWTPPHFPRTALKTVRGVLQTLDTPWQRQPRAAWSHGAACAAASSNEDQEQD